MSDKAAIFGINTYKTVPSLTGCVNDVENIRSLLTSVFGFDPKNVETFTDGKVTKAEVQRQMKWLFRDVNAGDRVVFHLSAHGSSIADKNGDEIDGEDEIFFLHNMTSTIPARICSTTSYAAGSGPYPRACN